MISNQKIEVKRKSNIVVVSNWSSVGSSIG